MLQCRHQSQSNTPSLVQLIQRNKYDGSLIQSAESSKVEVQ